MSIEQSSGEVAAERAKASDDDAGAGEKDLLSALPDDVLVLILLRLHCEEAAQTSILSRRWRRVWTLLPRLTVIGDSRWLPSALSASEVPLSKLMVGDREASPQSLETWLPAAARRVSGELYLTNFVSKKSLVDNEAEEDASQRGTFDLPCFEKATSIIIDLGFLGLCMPPVGVFARLTVLILSGVHFHGPGDLGDVLSSQRCPCLEELIIHNVRGLDSITIDFESLKLLDIENVRRVRQLTIVAPALEDLTLRHSLINDQNQPAVSVNISAPELKSLKWRDAYDPSSFHLGTMQHLEKLEIFFTVYGLDGFTYNHACLLLLPQLKAMDYLILTLTFAREIDNREYLMEDMTMLPYVTTLQLIIIADGHAFGVCAFHVLKICSGIKRLVLVLSSWLDLERQDECSSEDCICELQPEDWKTEELPLNCLQELEIKGLRASEHELAFVKRLLNWVKMLKTMTTITVTFEFSVTESETTKDLFQMF